MNVLPIRTKTVQAGESVYRLIDQVIPSMQEGDLLCVTSKILALCERRVARVEEKDACIKQESKRIIQTPWAKIGLMEDGWCINAGIDESNAKNGVVLLPKDPMKSARLIRGYIKKRFGLIRVGVLVTDTRSVPLRVGTVGRAIGWSGFSPMKNYIGKEDLYKRKSRMTQSNIADALSATAVLVMGEGNESIPLALIRQAPVEYVAKDVFLPSEMRINECDDIFRFIYQNERVSRDKKRRHLNER